MQHQTLYYGDCLDWMREWEAECVDLIYLDPPFNSNSDYNILFGTSDGTPAQVRAFEDTWKWDEAAVERTQDILNAVANPTHRAVKGLYSILGPSGMMAYLTYMAERLVEMQRLLKPTGSIYLHCDPTASHYLKIVMDAIFGKGNFRNEIIWHYRGGALTSAKRVYPRKHDVILFYSKSEQWAFNTPREDKVSDQMLRRWGRYLEPDGKTVRYKSIKHEPSEEARSRRRIIKSFGREPRDEDVAFTVKPSLVRSVWTDIPEVRNNPKYKESVGYPTQKPVALLERIVKASSNEGDFVLDPFCGCGTSIVAAQNLGRRWAGIDISSFAVDLIQERRLAPIGITAHTEGIPKDLAGARRLARDNPFDFESWAVYLVPGLAPNDRQTADAGIDGRGKMAVKPKNAASRLVLAQVKGGARFQLSHLRDFIHVLDREGAAMGVFVTLDRVASSQARAEARASGTVQIGAERFPRVQLWSIQEYFEAGAPIRMPTMLDPFTGKEIAIRQGLNM